MAKTYFPEWDAEKFKELLVRFPPNEANFMQVTQVEDRPQLEVGYQSGMVLLDHTYRDKVRTEIIVKIPNIEGLEFVKAAGSCSLRIIVGGSGRFVYTAFAESNQHALEVYTAQLQRIIFK